MTLTMIFNPISLLFWGFLIIITLFASYLYYKRGSEIENREDKIIMYSFAALLLGIAFNRLFAYMTHFNVPGNYVDHTFYGDYSAPYPLFYLFLAFGYISLGIGYTLFIFGFEFKFKKSKYVFTLASIVLSILILGLSFLRIVSTIYYQTISILILLMFARWSNFESKTIYYMLLFGFSLFGMALIFDTGDVKNLNLIPLFLSPSIYIAAICIIILPIRINPKYFRNTLKYWFFAGMIFIVIMALLITYSFFIAMPISLLIIVISFLLVSIIIFLYSIKDLKSQMDLEISSQGYDFLAIFKRHDKIPEEEVYKIAELQHIYIILKSGLTIYSKALKESPIGEKEAKDMLFGGAITAIELFLKDMYDSEKVLKEVKQEDVSILIEEGTYVRIAIIASHDQKALRKNMLVFLRTFEKQFEKPLKKGIADTRLFEPVNELIEKIFK